MEKKPISHIVAGVVIGLVLIVFFLAFYFTGNAFNKNALSYLPTVFFFGAIIFAIINWAKANNGNVTFGACFKYGFKTTAIVAIIMSLFLAIFIYTFPDYKEKFVEFMTGELEKGGADVSDEQQEKTLEVMTKFFGVSAVGGSLFMNLIFGAIASLIGAAVAKKNPENPFQQG